MNTPCIKYFLLKVGSTNIIFGYMSFNKYVDCYTLFTLYNNLTFEFFFDRQIYHRAGVYTLKWHSFTIKGCMNALHEPR